MGVLSNPKKVVFDEPVGLMDLKIEADRRRFIAHRVTLR